MGLVLTLSALSVTKDRGNLGFKSRHSSRGKSHMSGSEQFSQSNESLVTPNLAVRQSKYNTARITSKPLPGSCQCTGIRATFWLLFQSRAAAVWSDPSMTKAPLHTRRHQLALLSCIMRPAASQSSTAGLLCELLHACLQLGPEVADETLDRPGEGFTQSCCNLGQRTEIWEKRKGYHKACAL